MPDAELTNLSEFLDEQRSILLRKCDGLDDAQLRTTLAPSSLTLAGLLKHGALNEDWWFGYRFAGLAEQELWSSVTDDDPDWEFHSALSDPGDELRQLYRDACDRSRAVVAAAAGPGEVSVRARGDGVKADLRWVICHMIEETARHAGHADLLREAIDGETGE